MYIANPATNVELRRFPLGSRASAYLPQDLGKIKLVAGDVERSIDVPAGSFKLCVTGIVPRVQNPLVSAFGYSRELVPADFSVSFNNNPNFICQDKSVNHSFYVFTQWRAADNRRQAPEAGQLVETMAAAGFQAPAPDYKSYVGTYPGVPPSLSVYWFDDDRQAAEKVAETANAWLQTSGIKGTEFVVWDARKWANGHKMHEISLQFFIP